MNNRKEENCNEMLKIDSTSSSFESFRLRDCTYIDKTRYLYNLITSGSTYFFLSRPRRFGKSLTISTLEVIFKGRKELFDGLYISKTDYDFKKYPVIHIDFGYCQRKTKSETIDWINSELNLIADKYGITLDSKYHDVNFKKLIIELSEKHDKVVVLIDEYDKPLSDSVDNVDNALEIRDVLRSFFEVLKASAPYLRFVFITGVTKYSKVSIFSSMNNLKDLSLDPKYATMFGYTQEELEQYFADGIDESSNKLAISKTGYLEKIKEWYDGYQFAPSSETVYNPVSVGRFFEDGGTTFKPYWVSTGGQKLLYDIARKVKFDIENDIIEHISLIRLLGQDIVEVATGNVTKEKYNSLLLQTGYLTIAKSNETGTVADLGFPNYEVRTAFSEIIMPLYTNDEEIIDKDSLLDYLEQGEFDKFVEELKSDFARIPYYLIDDYEKSFHQAFYCMMLSLGAKIEAEVPTNKGRIDAVIETDKHIYIFEFKRNQSAAKAISQIRQKNYAERYLAEIQKGRMIHLVGVSFSSRKRAIGSIKIESIAIL